MKFFLDNKYETFIDFEVKQISCTCHDFITKKLKYEQLSGKLIPCKHFVELINNFKLDISNIVTNKRSVLMLGKDSLTEKEKEVLREMVNFTCQDCLKNESEVGTLEAHRIIRGNIGGKYVPNNILMKCHNCHWKKMHGNEFK